jgi:methyl-accepting chemotaxis protein WspA
LRFTLKRKMLILITAVALLPLLVTLGLTMQFRGAIATQAGQELETMAKANLAQTAKDVYGLFETTNDLVQARVNQSLDVTRQLLDRRGGAHLGGESVTWQASQQDSHEVQTVNLPRMMAGGTWLGMNRSPSAATPFVDDATHSAGDAVSVFQRMNDAGDMLRVATNVRNAAGERAVGTYIPAADQVAATVLRGQTCRRVAFLLGAAYMAAYEPLRDQGKIIGILSVGVRLDAIETLRRTVLGVGAGRTGYVVVVGGKGAQRGRYVISKDGKRDGENIWDTRDAEGNLVVQKSVGALLASQPGEVLFWQYPWVNSPGTPPVRKTSAMMYFAPWDWVINAGMDDDDYSAAVTTVRGGISGLMWRLSLAGLAALLLALMCAHFLGGRMVQPIAIAVEVTKGIAEGNVEAARQALAKSHDAAAGKAGQGRFADEATELLSALDAMSGNLDSLLGQVQRSGIQVNAAGMEIAASARQSEASVAEQAAATREVMATSKEISATSTDLLHTMQNVGESVKRAGSQAEQGQADLTRMSGAIEQLVRSTNSICSKLGVISERASKISSVVTTINKISDQTGLLALNAAIEAEKAGEYGRGFSVVAREISRLADQTAAATEDIEAVVHDMQSSVSGGVMEMDKFSDEVRRRAQEVSTIGQQVAGIIEQTEALGPEFEILKEGMQAQTQGAQQISEAMTQLSQSADQSRQALREFKSATEQLNGAVQGLQSEVARFRTTA